MSLQRWNVSVNVHLLSEGNVVPEQLTVTANTLKAAIATADWSAKWMHRTFHPGPNGSAVAVLPNCDIQILEVRALL